MCLLASHLGSLFACFMAFDAFCMLSMLSGNVSQVLVCLREWEPLISFAEHFSGIRGFEWFPVLFSLPLSRFLVCINYDDTVQWSCGVMC